MQASLDENGTKGTKLPWWQRRVRCRILIPILLVAVLVVVDRQFTNANARRIVRAQCIMNIRNAQQEVRQLQQSKGLNPGDPIDWKDLVGPGKCFEQIPTCLGHGRYMLKPSVPETGVLVLECALSAHPDKHISGDHHDW